MTNNYKPISQRRADVSAADHDAAIRIAKRQTNKFRRRGIHRLADDIANKALNELSRAMQRGTIHNTEAFLTWKITRLVFDADRSQRAEQDRLTIWANEMEVVKGKRLHDDYDNRGGFPFRGLSVDIISKEEQQMVNLTAMAIEEIMPDPFDRAVLADRFRGDFLTITELAHKHGKSPSSMANHLKKLLGTEDEIGAVASIGYVIGQLSIDTAVEFVREITRLDARDKIAKPIILAIAYLELIGTQSRVHSQQAAKATAHLRWLEANMPSSRGVDNKILHRLIRAACFYVLESNDARPDTHDGMGLHDDVAVVKAVQKAVAKFAK
jgi:uncharacterized membrane protein YkvA (DUF1232 family)